MADTIRGLAVSNLYKNAKQERQLFIVGLAIIHHALNTRLTYSQLNFCVAQAGLTPFGNNHGVASGVCGTWRYADRKFGRTIADMVAYSFTDKDGNHPFEN